MAKNRTLGFEEALANEPKNTNKVIIECDKKYFRPLDVNTLLGDSKKARKKLKWKPKINLNQLVDEMISLEMSTIENHN